MPNYLCIGGEAAGRWISLEWVPHRDDVIRVPIESKVSISDFYLNEPSLENTTYRHALYKREEWRWNDDYRLFLIPYDTTPTQAMDELMNNYRPGRPR